MVKNLPSIQDTWVGSLGQEDPLEEAMAPHSSILAWKSHGERSLAGYSPWGRRESDTTARTQHARMHTDHLESSPVKAF